MNTYLAPDSRETAAVLASKLALAFLHSLADTQERRNILTEEYYWAEELLTMFHAEGEQLFAEAPGMASEVNHAVMNMLILKGKQSV